MSNIKDLIQQLAKTENTDCILCTVNSIDLTAKTCYCIPINGDADLIDVKLIANDNKGFLLIPEVDSVVIVSNIQNSSYYVSMFSKVSEIQLNGDDYNGLIKIDDLTTSLNTIINNINTQLGLIATGISTGGGSYTPTLLTTLNKTTYENTTVKHGGGS